MFDWKLFIVFINYLLETIYDQNGRKDRGDTDVYLKVLYVNQFQVSPAKVKHLECFLY